MYFKSKKTSLIILAITALLVSRGTFALFNDSEGPNLLIVVVFGAILYLLSLVSYRFKFIKSGGVARLFLAIVTQVLIALVFYVVFR